MTGRIFWWLLQLMLVRCIYWLGSLAKDGVMGYWKADDEVEKGIMLFVKNRQVIEVDVQLPPDKQDNVSS